MKFGVSFLAPIIGDNYAKTALIAGNSYLK